MYEPIFPSFAIRMENVPHSNLTLSFPNNENFLVSSRVKNTASTQPNNNNSGQFFWPQKRTTDSGSGLVLVGHFRCCWCYRFCLSTTTIAPHPHPPPYLLEKKQNAVITWNSKRVATKSKDQTFGMLSRIPTMSLTFFQWGLNMLTY